MSPVSHHLIAGDCEIIISRTVRAPQEIVFSAWTDPQQITQWWGPKGFTTTTHEMDVREGGIWRFLMHGPDGIHYPNKIAYEEVTVPERLVYAQGADDEGDPFHVTVTFTGQENHTSITMRVLFASVEECENMKKACAVEGANSSLDCLEEYLAKK